MSRPVPPGGIPPATPEQTLRELAAPYRGTVDPGSRRLFEARLRDLGLRFDDDELDIVAALETPDKVQRFLNERIYYNDDHAAVEQDETARPPRQVLRTGAAHCFEGALFAYAVNALHGHEPRLVMLEASQDADHNLVVCRDPVTGLYGANAQSRYPGLVGRPAQFPTVRALADSYLPFYYSDRTLDPNDLTLVGYSDPIDLVARFGPGWMGTLEPLWDIYYTYIDAGVSFHYFFDDPGTPHAYPAIKALKENWIRIGPEGKPFVSLADLPPGAKDEWDAFWAIFDPADVRPRGRAQEIERAFFRLTGTTPIDLDDNAFDLQFYLAAGYRIDHLLGR